MTVGRICVRQVDTAGPEESVQVAAQRMYNRRVGTLVVQGQDGEPIGIVTDRDLALRVVAQGKDPFQTTVGEIMTVSPTAAPEDTPIETALSLMRSGPFRRLPVVDDRGRLVGLLSLDDILDLLAEEFTEIGELIQEESPRSLSQL